MLYPAELRARRESSSDSKAFAAIPKIKSSSFTLLEWNEEATEAMRAGKLLHLSAQAGQAPTKTR
jgi:hypothetical protein